MPTPKGKKPATTKDLEALLRALTGFAEAPEQATNAERKKRKNSYGSTALQAVLSSENDLEAIAGNLAPSSGVKRTARRAPQKSEPTARVRASKKSQKVTPKTQRLKSSARRQIARGSTNDVDTGEKTDNRDDDDDCSSKEESLKRVKVARKINGTTRTEDVADGEQSPSSDDAGGEDFVLAMQRMIVERRKKREKDEKKIDSFFLARMKKNEKLIEQRVLAIGAQASEATRLYRTSEVTATQKKMIAETKVIKDLTKLISTETKETLARFDKEIQRFQSTRNDALALAAAESKSRKHKLQVSIAKTKATSLAEVKKRTARQKLLADALAAVLKCAE